MTPWTPDVSAGTDPIDLAIAKAVVAEIVNGRLSPGDRLPPYRKLARELNVSIRTVTRGYMQAMRRGVGVTPSIAFVVTDCETPRAVRICLAATKNRDQLRTSLNLKA